MTKFTNFGHLLQSKLEVLKIFLSSYKNFNLQKKKKKFQ